MYTKGIKALRQRVVLRFFLLAGLILGGLQLTNGQTVDISSIEQRIEALLACGDPDTIQPFLSDRFSIGAYSLPSALGCLKSVAKGFGYKKVQIVRKKRAAGNEHLFQIEFSKKGGKTRLGKVLLDDSGKIVYIDVFDKLYGMDRNAHSTLIAEVPFETDDQGSVILDVKLNNNDRVLKLLFDTGADGMALSERLADSLGIKSDLKQSTSVVGGRVDIEIARDNTVYLGAMKLPHQSIALFKKIDKYDGIIGNMIVRSYITEVNYDKQTVSFYSFGDFNLQSRLGKNGQLVDVTLPAGLIIVPGSLSVTKDKPHKGDFVFDLGAAYSLICFRPFVKHNRLLVDGFKPAYSGSTTSLGMTTPTFTGPAASFRFGNLPGIEGLPVTLMSGGGQSESWNPGFDGSIGTRLISKYNFIIDMQHKKILLQPNGSFSYPGDFTHSNMLFGFDTKGELRFQNYVGMPAPEGGLCTGVKVLAINGVSSEQLRADQVRLQSLLNAGANSKWVLKYQQDGVLKEREI